MGDVFDNAIDKLHEFIGDADPSMFFDDEEKSQVVEACEMLIRRKILTSAATDVCGMLGYPYKSAEIYAQFIEHNLNNKCGKNKDSDFRHKLAHLLADTRQPSDNFEIVFK